MKKNISLIAFLFIATACHPNKTFNPDNVQISSFDSLDEMVKYVSSIHFSSKNGIFFQPYFNESFLNNKFDCLYQTWGYLNSWDINDIYRDNLVLRQQTKHHIDEECDIEIEIETFTLFGYERIDSINEPSLINTQYNENLTIYQYAIDGNVAFRIQIEKYYFSEYAINEEELIIQVLNCLNYQKGEN